MSQDLTDYTHDELAAYRASADADLAAARDRKVAVRDELQRREAKALLGGLTPGQLDVLRQEIGGVGGIDEGALGGIG